MVTLYTIYVYKQIHTIISQYVDAIFILPEKNGHLKKIDQNTSHNLNTFSPS